MEYSYFKNQSVHRIVLDEYSLTFEDNTGKRSIPYAQISKVRLRRPKPVEKENLFSCEIHITDQPSIHLQSYSIENDVLKSQFNHYNQFVRVLHFHLMSKSAAKFCYGMPFMAILLYILMGLTTIAASYTLNFLLKDYSVLLYAVTPVIIAVILYKILADKPGTYRPDIIPYHILPTI